MKVQEANKIIIKILLVLTLFLPRHVFADTTPLVFVQTHLGAKFQCAQKALTTAYKKLNIDVSFMTIPAKRALKMANDGKADGEMLRVAGVEKNFPNLIPIPIPLCEVESRLVANKKVKANSFDELQNYRFGIVVGFVHQENKVKEFGLTAVRVNENKKLVELMLLDRVDAIFLSRRASVELLNNPQKKEFKVLNFFSRKVHLYHYLHKKHRKLVPKITRELEQMAINGEIDLQDHHR